MTANWALIVLGATAVAGAAHAEAPTRAPQPMPRLSPVHTLVTTYGPARTFGAPDGSPTSVDHRFSSGGPTASAGFLCGLQPGASETGAAAAHGFDPQGRFVGARLRFAFR